MAQRPRPPSPQITWREVKSARRRPPLLRSRPGSPERPRRTTGAVRRRPRPTRTTCVSQCFSVQFFTFPVVSRPTRGLPVDGRVRNAFPNISVYATRPPGWPVAILPVVSRRTRRGPPVDGRTCNDHPNSSMCDTTTSGELSGRLPSDARSSGRQPVSPRSSDHFDIRHDQVATNERVSGRRPSDARSSGRLPSSQCYSGHFRIRHAGRPTSSVHVRWREGEDRAVSRRSPGTARAVLRSSRIFRPAHHATAVPHIV